MGTLRAAAVAAAAVLAAPAPAAPGEALETFTGTAHRRGHGEVLYTEEHEVRRDGERLVSARTVYRDPDGRPIATLDTDFTADPFAPGYVFEDLRTGEAEAVSRAGDALELRAGGRARAVRPPSDPARRLVTGQGLDRLVRAHLRELAAGARLELAYVIPARLDTFELRARAAGASERTLRVRAEFSSWVMRLLAPSLEVEYDRETRRLLRYRGPTNLSFEGENPEVEITYAYPPGEAKEQLREES